MIRIMPDIPRIKARWAHRASEIPDWLEVPMADGSVVRYYPHIEQPSFRKSMEMIRDMKNQIVGYQMKEPADAATSDRPQKKI